MYIQGNLRKDVMYECRDFVTAAAICTDKTLITLNFLNSNEHSHAVQPTREGCASWACSFEFKILRLHRVLSIQIAVIYIEPSY